MSMDRMSGTGRSARAALCGGLDKELDVTVDALSSAEEDTVGKTGDEKRGDWFRKSTSAPGKCDFGKYVRHGLSNVLGCKQKSAGLMLRSEQQWSCAFH